ncbi:hypothetical protein NRA39_00715 [Acinetobacter baumannii]|nr:hypothetical protein [Acinetobacter baumannii]
MTDLNKERELFLKFHYEQYLRENPEVKKENAKYIYDYAHKNMLVDQLRESHFVVWLAAKAQAVPEGYVLLPRVPTEKMFQAYERYSVAPMSTLSKTGYKAMVEASESGAEQ